MRKKFFKTLAAAVLIGSMMSVPAWAESAVVTGSEVNLRAGPGTNYRIVDCLERGTTVNVTQSHGGSGSQATAVQKLFSSHPDTDTRIQRMSQRATEEGYKRPAK